MARIITTKYIGPTNTKGSRIQVKTWLKTHYVSWDSSLDSEENHSMAVAFVLYKINKERDYTQWHLTAGGMMPDDSGYGFVVDLS